MPNDTPKRRKDAMNVFVTCSDTKAETGKKAKSVDTVKPIQ
jgi:hypothetical protein